jgi:predicted O-linked N-acetylglucosamine transferase (SPINDLY family)
VTLAGPNTAGRVGAGLLAALGLSELVASDPQDYVRRAVAAATDFPQLASWRATLRGRLAPLLGDGVRFTAELEEAFREMWRTWCETRRR